MTVVEIETAASHMRIGDLLGDLVVTGRHLYIVRHNIAHLRRLVLGLINGVLLCLLLYYAFHTRSLIALSRITKKSSYRLFESLLKFSSIFF